MSIAFSDDDHLGPVVLELNVAGRETEHDPRRKSQRAGHHGHGRGELLAVSSSVVERLGVGQPVHQIQRGVAGRHVRGVPELPRVPEPRLEYQRLFEPSDPVGGDLSSQRSEVWRRVVRQLQIIVDVGGTIEEDRLLGRSVEDPLVGCLGEDG